MMTVQLLVQPQNVPFTARQVARLVMAGLISADFLPPNREVAEEAMDAAGGPSLMFKTADGSEWLVTVEQVQ
jgi:hypothetical protein